MTGKCVSLHANFKTFSWLFLSHLLLFIDSTQCREWKSTPRTDDLGDIAFTKQLKMCYNTIQDISRQELHFSHYCSSLPGNLTYVFQISMRTHCLITSLQKTLQTLSTAVLPYLVNGYSVDIGVVHKPNDLIREKLSVVLRGQVGLCGFTGVQLKAFPDSLSQHVQSGIGLHDLRHGLLDEGLHTREPVTKGAVTKGERSVTRSPKIKNTYLYIVSSSCNLSFKGVRDAPRERRSSRNRSPTKKYVTGH